MNKIVFFDMDGTLVSYQDEVIDSAVDAIQALKDKGHIPFLATGRSPQMLEENAKIMGIDNYIAMNGQYIVYQDEILFENPFQADVVEGILDTAYQNGDRGFLIADYKIIGNPYFEGMMDKDFFKLSSEVFSKLDEETVNKLFEKTSLSSIPRALYEDEKVLQVILNIPEERDDLYRQLLPEVHLTRSSKMMVDVLPFGNNKAEGIKRVVKALGADMDQTVAFGDNLNDLEMVEEAGIGVAMANGRDELKAVADHVTTAFDEDGIARGLEALNLI